MSVSQDVLVLAQDESAVTVVSRESGAPGERCRLTLAESNVETSSVRVFDSRPAVIDGSIRHVLQLKLVADDVPDAL